MTARDARFPLGARVSLADLDASLHETAARLRPTEPISWVPALGGWLVVGHAEAMAVLRDASTFTVDDPRFSTAQVLGPSMLSTDGTDHSRHRRPFVPSFSRTALDTTQAAIVDSVIARLLAALPATALELRPDLARPVATEIITEVLGLGCDAATVASWYDEFAVAVTALSNAGAATSSVSVEATGSAPDQLQSAVDDARSAKELRRASVIAQAADVAGDLDAAEFASNVGVVLFGAIETSEGMNATALWHLLTVPGLRATVAANPTAVAALVDESLRLEPAAAVVDRYATRDVQIGPAAIRAGEFVQVSLAGANRDPAVFDDPDAFDVSRPERARHLSFVVGPHACIGAHLARHQTRRLVEAVVTAHPRLRLVEPSVEAPHGRIFRKPGPLRVTV